MNKENKDDYSKIIEEIKDDLRERKGFKKNQTYFSTDVVEVEEVKKNGTKSV